MPKLRRRQSLHYNCDLEQFVHVTCFPYYPHNIKLYAEDVGNVVEGERLQGVNIDIKAVKAAGLLLASPPKLKT
jgi:hypothetical protein